MEWLYTAIGVVITVIVTAIVNYCLGKPKQWKEQKEQQKQWQEYINKAIESIGDSIKDLKDRVAGLENKVEEGFNEQDRQNKIVMQALQQTTRVQLDDLYEKYRKRGYATTAEKERVEKLYEAYHALGANGLVDAAREEFLTLPTTKKIKDNENIE